jgi:hypothetical protein
VLVTSTDPRDILAMRAAQAPTPAMTRGSSSYFSTPSEGLDPNLFEGDKMLAGVREWLVSTGYGYLNSVFHGAHNWATFWVAGSGITHQWSAARDPGDLDVLIGVKTRVFRQHNPQYRGMDDGTVARRITESLKTGLWPRTANQQIGTAHYEVTWYVNAGAEDIRDINPYAAYNVTKDSWTVRPPDLPGDWGTHNFPADWWAQVGREQKNAHTILQDYLAGQVQYRNARSTPDQVNAAQQMRYAAVQAATFFQDVHHGRQQAFSPTGEGYRDWHNFRWQAHKRNGVLPAMHALAALHEESNKESEVARYGHALASTEQALTTASLITAHLQRSR